MTNNEIVEYIYREIDIKKLIRIYSRSNGNIASDDFEQTLYLILLEYDNDKLNYIFKADKLTHLIVGIIRNQNNDIYSIYNKIHKNLKLDWYKYKTELEIEADQELLDKAEQVIHTYSSDEEYFYKKLLHIYVKHNESFNSLAKKTGLSKKTISDAIQLAKFICRIELKEPLD